MNSSTSSFITPAATLRTGWGEGVPRGTQSKTSIPFAAIPHDIAADPRLSPTAVLARTRSLLASRPDALYKRTNPRDGYQPSRGLV